MKKFLNIVSVVVLSSVCFTSCLKNDSDIDTEKPVIKLNAPENEEAIEVGSSIHFDMDVSDNIALGSYDIDIHSADGHTHTHSVVLAEGDHDHEHDPENDARKAFKYKNSWDDIRGLKNAHIHHHEIEIPEDAKRGEYHFVVKVLDAAGNQAMEYRTIDIVDKGQGGGDHGHTH